ERNRDFRAGEARTACAPAASDYENRLRRRCARPYARLTGKSRATNYLRNETERNQGRNLAGHASDSLLMTDVAVLARLAALEIETPSWGYGNSGTRFHVYPWPGAARTVWERIDDAALVHELTGCCPSVALHIPWDRVDDWNLLGKYAADRGVRIGAINPNTFGDDAYRLGSLCHPDATVRRRRSEERRVGTGGG